MEVKHPAKFNDQFIPIFARLLNGKENVLDPFAGTGKLALIKSYGFKGKVICNEIEEEYANNSTYSVDDWHIGDSANMEWAEDSSFAAICTSPTYGNRMADHFDAKDNSKRITYRHILGRPLNQHNTGRMQWGNVYRDKHIEIYRECKRVLKPHGLLIINMSDHIRKGTVVPVTDWHKNTILDLEFSLIKELKIETQRMGFGRNNNLRVNYESILVFEKTTVC
jgi:DNA modification methylase